MRTKRWIIACLAMGLGLSSQAALTHRYTFDGNVNDSVGSFNGTPTADAGDLESPAYVADTPTGIIAMAPSSALEVGMNFGTKVSGFSVNKAVISTNTGSYSLWVKADAMANGRYVIAALPLPTGPSLIGNSTTQFKVIFGDEKSPVYSTVSTGVWYHVTATWNNPAGTSALYVDGALVGTTNFTPNSITPTIVNFGNFAFAIGNANNQFEGLYYDVQFYDHELSAYEVEKLHAYPGSTAVAEVAGSGAVVLNHRYLFDNDLTDEIGTADGISETNIQYVADAPAGTVGPANSLAVGGNDDTAPSGFKTPNAAMTTPSGSFSVWLKADTQNNTDYMLGGNGFKVKPEIGFVKAVYTQDGGTAFTGFGSTPMQTDEWTHVVFTWNNDTSNRTFFVNGAWAGTVTDAIPVVADKVNVGNLNLNTAGNQFDGSFYDFQFYAGELSSDEVLELYANPGSAIIPVPPELTHRYAFNSDANDAVGTLSGSLTEENGSTIEAPLFTTDIPAGANTGFASHSIELGMNLGTKASSVNFGGGAQAQIYDGKSGSVAYWFKADQLLNGRDMLSSIGGANALRTLLLNNGQLRLAGAGMGNMDFTFSNPVTVDTWHHLVVTWDDAAGIGSIALDGDMLAYTFTPGALVDPGRLILGNFANDDSQLGTQFDGHIYDLQIYDDVLSAAHAAQLAANPGTQLFSEIPSFPALVEMIGPNLIPNGDFSVVTNLVGTPTGAAFDEKVYNFLGGYGDFSVLWGAIAEVPGWAHYHADPYSLISHIGTVHADDGGVPVLDGTYYLDTNVDTDDGHITLNSSMDYLNGLIQTDILGGVTVNPAATYKLSIDVFQSNPGTHNDASSFEMALTAGSGADSTNTATAVAGSLFSVAATNLPTGYGTDSSGTYQVKSIDGADLLAAQSGGPVNVIFNHINTTPIANYPTSPDPLLNTQVSQVRVADISLVEVLVPESGDYNRDGVVDQFDVAIANSYLDGSIDGGPTAAERQAVMSLEELNLTEFDLDGDGVFDGDDVVVLEGLARPIILRASMNGTGSFDVQVGSLGVGAQYYLMRTTSLDLPFDVQVDSVTAASGTETLSDSNPPAGKAFYKVTK